MCTAIRFTDAQNNLFFGRNLDWSCGYGEQVLTVPRNFKRTWEYEEPCASAPALIGMGVLENETPLLFDCANENGLAIAALNFPGWAEYEKKPVSDKTNICAYEFPFWVASTFSSVDEAEQALGHTAIVAKAPGNYSLALLHWIIADKTRAIAVEYTSSGMHIYHDNLDVLANQPAFLWHQENVRNYMDVTNEFPHEVTWGTQTLDAYGTGFGMRALPGDFSSPSRFVRAAYFNAHYPTCASEKENVARLFHTLQGVAMIKGGAKMADGDFEYTVYTGGFSESSKTYYYRTYDDLTLRSVSMDAIDLDGRSIIVTPQ